MSGALPTHLERLRALLLDARQALEQAEARVGQFNELVRGLAQEGRVPRGVFLGLVVGEMGEIAAHQPAGLAAVLEARFVIEIGYLLETAEAHGRGKGRHDQPAPQSRRQFDGRLGKGSHIGRQRPLDRLRRNPHVIERKIFTIV